MKRTLGAWIRNHADWPPLIRLAKACETYLRYFYNERYFWDTAHNGEEWFFSAWAQNAMKSPAGAVPPVILDIGANRGDWAEMALADLTTHAPGRAFRILSFEPNPGPFALLEKTVARHAGKAVALEAHNLGVSARAAKLTLQVPVGDHTAASFSPRGDLGELRNVAVEVIAEARLARLIGDAPLGFVKIDTEGHEADVIEGLTGLIAKHRPTVQLEYGKTFIPAGRTLGEIARKLEPLNYRLARLHPTWVSWFKYDFEVHESFRYINLVAVPAEDAAAFRSR